MRLVVNSSSGKKDTSGILYLLAFTLEGTPLVKIGMTQRPKVEERVCEILTDIWKHYRVFPECYVKRFRKVEKVVQKETALLKQFSADSFTPQKIFTGHTELVTTDLEIVVEAYDLLTNPADKLSIEQEDGFTEKLKEDIES